jgi:hypothetical protein
MDAFSSTRRRSDIEMEIATMTGERECARRVADAISLAGSHNILLDTETQPRAAASPQWLCSGQRQR